MGTEPRQTLLTGPMPDPRTAGLQTRTDTPNASQTLPAPPAAVQIPEQSIFSPVANVDSTFRRITSAAERRGIQLGLNLALSPHTGSVPVHACRGLPYKGTHK